MAEPGATLLAALKRQRNLALDHSALLEEQVAQLQATIAKRDEANKNLRDALAAAEERARPSPTLDGT